ncbi:MAG: dihydrofolate reductase [Chitinophagaceae bacterium]|nr:dihydrofolate reductase [Chitinophagaceae bacterium]
MRKIIVTQFITLDGVMENPHLWSFPYFTDEITKFKIDELFASDAQLLGRVTYEAFLEHWPSQTGEYANRLNSLPKYAVSKTLKTAAWNNSILINKNIEEEISKLKLQKGQNILVHGSLTLVKALLKANLIDQFNLLVFPVVLGKGIRLFENEENIKLTLTETKTYTSGVVLLTYQSDKTK